MQSILNLMIEIIFVTFFITMFVEFVVGLLQLLQHTASVTPESVSDLIAIVNKQTIFKELADPWTMEFESETLHREAIKIETIVFHLPTLKLLPPAKEIQPEQKRRGRPKKINTTSTPKTTSTRKRKSPQKAVA